NRITIMRDTRLVNVGTAHELYDRPPSSFTAEFLGNANLIPAHFESYDAERQEAMIRLGEHSCKVFASRQVDPGNEYVMCIRPHALEVGSNSGSENTIEGQLTSVQWLGSQYRLYLDVLGREIRVDAPRMRQMPRIGDRIPLCFSAQDATLLE